MAQWVKWLLLTDLNLRWELGMASPGAGGGADTGRQQVLSGQPHSMKLQVQWDFCLKNWGREVIGEDVCYQSLVSTHAHTGAHTHAHTE